MAKSKQNKNKKKSTQNENKLIYIPFAVLIVVIVLLVVFPYINHNPSTGTITANANTPLFNVYKVSNTNYVGNNSVEIYFISWYGCPNGATASWPLYLALRHFGNVSVVPHYSIYESDLGSAIPGLLFLNYTPYPTSHVYFHPIYIYGQYLNETTNGTPINTDDVTFGLQELKSMVPNWVYNLVVYYEVNQTYTQIGTSPAYYGKYPHIITIIIISGPGGTWVDLGYPNSISPQTLAGLNSTVLYNAILKNNPALSGQYASAYENITNATNILLNTIVKASS
ncbi:DUF929 domain-containing protein [Sulfolobus tengchongensis]|uniref:DUF929 domain-containing protein n=1 Tax=Sulfolobus tengchongensis TaxID=207809 RepID=A0AAX4L5R0_9CREN